MSLVPPSAGKTERAPSATRASLAARAGEQRQTLRWWAAECRQRNAACRRRFTAANVAAATQARAVLRGYAAAWSETRRMLRESGPDAAVENRR